MAESLGVAGGSASTDAVEAVPVAVVVGLDNITGLQTARILADRGVPVVGVVTNLRHWAAHTTVCEEIVRADGAGDGLITALQQLGRRLGRPAVLFPCTDPSVRTLSEHRDRLAQWFALPLASHDIVSMLMDKASFSAYAETADLPVPRTRTLSDRSDAEAAAAQLTFPAVVKPSAKSATWDQHTAAKGIRVADGSALLDTYDLVSSWSPVLLVQEWVEGGENGLFSCNAYFDRQGVPLVTFVARKVRQWPPDIGTSASGEECRQDEVLAAALQLFGGAGYHGLAYLEMKRDARNGRLVIIEPNVGRPTGRSAIAEGGGVELVYTAYCDAVGLPLPVAREQRYVGAKWLDLRRDAQAAFVARRRGELTVAEWLASLRGPKAHAIWSSRDPKPFALDIAQATASGVRRLPAPLYRWVASRRSVSPHRGGMLSEHVP